MLMSGSEKFRQVCNPRFPVRAPHPDSQKGSLRDGDTPCHQGGRSAALCTVSGQLASHPVSQHTRLVTVLGILASELFSAHVGIRVSQFLLSLISACGNLSKPIVHPPLPLLGLLYCLLLEPICIPI